jgi:hypothetical protein
MTAIGRSCESPRAAGTYSLTHSRATLKAALVTALGLRPAAVASICESGRRA